MTTGRRAPAYGPQLGEAIAWAAALHASQTRKGKTEPYLTHLLRVTGLVIKYGGSETQAIAGVLHDAPEDCGGQPVLDEIGARFGPEAMGIVAECSDSLTADRDAKAPWRERKIAYIEHATSHLSDPAALVAACDKISNLEDMVEDFQREGEPTLERFSGGAAGTRAYYRAMYAVLAPRLPNAVAAQFARLVLALDPKILDLIVGTDPVSQFAAATAQLPGAD